MFGDQSPPFHTRNEGQWLQHTQARTLEEQAWNSYAPFEASIVEREVRNIDEPHYMYHGTRQTVQTYGFPADLQCVWPAGYPEACDGHLHQQISTPGYGLSASDLSSMPDDFLSIKRTGTAPSRAPSSEVGAGCTARADVSRGPSPDVSEMNKWVCQPSVWIQLTS